VLIVSMATIPGYEITSPVAFVAAAVKNLASAESALEQAAMSTGKVVNLESADEVFAIVSAVLSGSTTFGSNLVAYGTLVRAKRK